MAPSGQASIVDQSVPLLHARASMARSPEGGGAFLGAMRAACWCRVATSRIDDGESAFSERLGFLVEIEADEAVMVDVLAYPYLPEASEIGVARSCSLRWRRATVQGEHRGRTSPDRTSPLGLRGNHGRGQPEPRVVAGRGPGVG
ncbi:MAG: hypothetical protein ACHQ01_11215, partial [Candidatus Limnocylindrales bacterium]